MSIYNINNVVSNDKVEYMKIKDVIKEILLADENKCWSEIEPYIISPGVCGSRSFDQHQAVCILRTHDVQAKIPLGVPDRLLWTEMYKVLQYIGFKVQYGRITGLLEYRKPEKSQEDDSLNPGEPDID